MSDEQDPLWKQVWKTEGIRYLGPDGSGVIDAMERFRHAFELGWHYALQAEVKHRLNEIIGEVPSP